MIRKLLKASHNRRRLIWIWLLILMLGASISFLLFLNHSHSILPDKAVREVYATVDCKLLGKKLNTNRLFINKYRADFLISYAVDGVSYRRWVSGNGLDQTFYADASDQKNILVRYRIGQNYNCFYNPDNHEQVVLVLRHDWGSLFPAISVMALTMIFLYYVIKNIIFVFRDATRSAREKLKQRKNKQSK